MKAKLIITTLLLSLLLIFSGCATVGHGVGGSMYLYGAYPYGGSGPYYWYPGYGYYGYYGFYGGYPWYYPWDDFDNYPRVYQHNSPYIGHRDGSRLDHGTYHNGKGYTRDLGNVRNHTVRHYANSNEGLNRTYVERSSNVSHWRGNIGGVTSRGYISRGGDRDDHRARAR